MLPAEDLRSNIWTCAVPTGQVPAVAKIIADACPAERYDPAFQGQTLQTTYFDTPTFKLRKARNKGGRYLTLRIRRYGPSGAYALSAKTEDQKFRVQLPKEDAEAALSGDYAGVWQAVLPGDLVARLLALADAAPLVPAVQVSCWRYAVENVQDRFTLDLDIATDTGKRLGTNVLELKSTAPSPGALPPEVAASLAALRLRPLKLSKFLWATQWR